MVPPCANVNSATRIAGPEPYALMWINVAAMRLQGELTREVVANVLSIPTPSPLMRNRAALEDVEDAVTVGIVHARRAPADNEGARVASSLGDALAGPSRGKIVPNDAPRTHANETTPTSTGSYHLLGPKRSAHAHRRYRSRSLAPASLARAGAMRIRGVTAWLLFDSHLHDHPREGVVALLVVR